MNLSDFNSEIKKESNTLTNILERKDYCKKDGIAMEIAKLINMHQFRAFLSAIDNLLQKNKNKPNNSPIDDVACEELSRILSVLSERNKRGTVSKDFYMIIDGICKPEVMATYGDFFIFYKLLSAVVCFHPYSYSE